MKKNEEELRRHRLIEALGIAAIIVILEILWVRGIPQSQRPRYSLADQIRDAWLHPAPTPEQVYRDFNAPSRAEIRQWAAQAKTAAAAAEHSR